MKKQNKDRTQQSKKPAGKKAPKKRTTVSQATKEDPEQSGLTRGGDPKSKQWT